MVPFVAANFPECTNQRIIQHRMFWIQRENKVLDNKEEEQYVYYVYEAVGLEGVENGLSFVYGSKDGTCSMGLTPIEGNQQCGFQEHLLKHCFQDRGKTTKNPLKKPGFDPRKKGPHQWNIQKLAKDASKHCNVMIHAELINREGSTDEEKLIALRDVSYVVDAAREARFGADGPDKEKSIDTVFLDIKKGGKRTKMVITHLEVFNRVFRKNNPEFETRLGEFQLLLTRVLPDMFFCVCNGKCASMDSESDMETNTIFQNLLKPNSKTFNICSLL